MLIKSVWTLHVHRDCYQLTSRQLIFLWMNQSVFAVLSLAAQRIWLTAHTNWIPPVVSRFLLPITQPPPSSIDSLTPQRGDLLLPWYTQIPNSMELLDFKRKYFVILIEEWCKKFDYYKALFWNVSRKHFEQIALGPNVGPIKYFVWRNDNCITMAQRWALIRQQPIRGQ